MSYLENIKKRILNLSVEQKVIVGILLVAVLIGAIFFINPAKKFMEMRNSQRRSDVTSILNAVYQYSVDNNGALPFSLEESPQHICRSGAQDCQHMIDLSQIIKDKKYQLNSVPVDPQAKGQNDSGYQISKLASGRINVTAPLAEKANISLSK